MLLTILRIFLDTNNSDCYFTVSTLLPLSCIATLVGCIGMSAIMHYSYPHVDTEGNRHRKNKPTEYIFIGSCHGNVLLIVLITENQNQSECNMFNHHAVSST